MSNDTLEEVAFRLFARCADMCLPSDAAEMLDSLVAAAPENCHDKRYLLHTA